VTLDQPIMTGGIIAAGEGSRLRQAGYTVPKPLVPVAGTPLIERVIANFLAAGIKSLVIIFNEEGGPECERWIRSRFPDVDIEIVIKTTASSLESFFTVAERIKAGPALISTVDAWCLPNDFKVFAEEAARRPVDATVLAVTPFVADERPLWALLDKSGRVKSLGGDTGTMVTAGMYLVPERVRRLSVPKSLTRLRDFLGWLVVSGEPVFGIPIEVVVDVDRGEDVPLAAALASAFQSNEADRSSEEVT
jgi:NDP-sugar pyrophosphorylase family protein